MHVLTATTALDLGAAGKVAPGRYLVEDVNGAELLVMADRGTATLEPLRAVSHPMDDEDDDLRGPNEFTSKLDFTKDWNGKHILLMRSGGLGDMMFMTPLLRELRRRWPRVSLSIACRKERFSVFDGLDLANGHVPTPVSVDLAASFDAVLGFEHVIEREKSAHYVDALAAHVGVELPAGDDSRRIQYAVTAFERTWAALRYPRKAGVKRLGIQVLSGSRYRSYPRDQTGSVAMAFLTRGWEVFLIGVKGDAPQKERIEGLRNLAESGLSFRQSVAALQTCDVILGPDSAIVHVAGALNIPTVALFAAIPAPMRVKYAPSITALEGSGKCSPCYFHERGGLAFPKDGPCAKSGKCDVLASIPVEKIVRAIEEKVA